MSDEQCDQKNDPPDYSFAGESTLGTLVIGGEPLMAMIARADPVFQHMPTRAPDREGGANTRQTVDLLAFPSPQLFIRKRIEEAMADRYPALP